MRPGRLILTLAGSVTILCACAPLSSSPPKGSLAQELDSQKSRTARKLGETRGEPRASGPRELGTGPEKASRSGGDPRSIEEELQKARERLGARAGKGGLDVSSFSEDDERLIGEAMARAILSRHETLPIDAEPSLYVRKVGALLAARSARPGIPYRFSVIDAPEVNAFATPYGYIFITAGALRFLENEAELAVILAHEIAHVERKHGLEAIVRAELDIDKRGARDRLDKLAGPLPEGERKTLEALLKEIDRYSDLVQKGHGLPREIEADRAALRLVSRVGYDPSAALDIFVRMAKSQSGEGTAPLIFRSHPGSRERLETARAIIARLPRGGAIPVTRFEEATRSLRRDPAGK